MTAPGGEEEHQLQSIQGDEPRTRDDQDGSGQAGPRRPLLVIAVLSLLMFIVSTQTLVITPLLPRIRAELAVPAALLGTLITAYATAVGLTSIVGGPVSDRVGRRRVLIAGAGIMLAALFGHWTTRGFWSLFLVRVLAGVAGGLLQGGVISYVADVFPSARRGWANGWVMSGTSAGLIAGIPLGSFLGANLGFRFPFLLLGATLAVIFVFLWVVLPEPDVPLTEELSIGSAVLAYRSLLARRDVQVVVAVFFLMFAGNSLYLTYLPVWLTESLAAGGTAIGLMFGAGGVGAVLAGPPAGRFSDRWGRKPVIVVASMILAGLMAVTTGLIVQMWVAYALFFVLMSLFAARAAAFQTMLPEMVDSRQRGSFLSLTVGLGQVAGGLGGGLAGAAYAGVGYGGTVMFSAGLMAVAGLLVWHAVPETAASKRRSPP